MHKTAGLRFDIARLQDDMTARGWLPIDLARAAGVSHMTVSRFLSGERRTVRTAKKLADAFGKSVRRYVPSLPAAEPDGSLSPDEQQTLPFQLQKTGTQ